MKRRFTERVLAFTLAGIIVAVMFPISIFAANSPGTGNSPSTGGSPGTGGPEIENVPGSVSSDKWAVDNGSNIISKLSVGTTVQNLLSSINESRYVEIRKGNSKVDNSSLAGTGMTVCIMKDTLVKRQYTIVVTGDTNGDGKINITDMINSKALVLGKDTVKGPYAKAADVNGDGKVNITDFIRTKAHILGKSTISGVTAD